MHLLPYPVEAPGQVAHRLQQVAQVVKAGRLGGVHLPQDFNTLNRVVTARSGVILKTIGDAIMAAFEKPQDGVAAAIEMYAVTLNDRIDYFWQWAA